MAPLAPEIPTITFTLILASFFSALFRFQNKPAHFSLPGFMPRAIIPFGSILRGTASESLTAQRG